MALQLRLKVLGNISYTREIVVPSLLSTFAAAFRFSIPAQVCVPPRSPVGRTLRLTPDEGGEGSAARWARQPLRETFSLLEDRTVAMAVMRSQAAVTRALEDGMLWAGMNWQVIGKPSGAAPHPARRGPAQAVRG